MRTEASKIKRTLFINNSEKLDYNVFSIDALYQAIVSSILAAYEKLDDYLDTCQDMKSFKPSNRIWWRPELTELKRQLRDLHREHLKSDPSDQLNSEQIMAQIRLLKKDFRKLQR